MNVLVQGGSRGIGLAMAKTLANDPQIEHLFVSCRNPSERPGFLQWAEDAGPRIHVLQMNVASDEDVGSAYRDVHAKVGALHMVINVAGMLHHADTSPEKRVEHLKADALHKLFAVHAVGPALIAKHFFPLLRHDARCVFANLSARVGSIDDNRKGGWYAYRMSKAAQNMLTKTLSIEFSHRAPNVICTALHPGTVDTELSKPFSGRVQHVVFSPEESAAHLLTVIAGLEAKDSGGFFAWDGQPIPW